MLAISFIFVIFLKSANMKGVTAVRKPLFEYFLSAITPAYQINRYYSKYFRQIHFSTLSRMHATAHAVLPLYGGPNLIEFISSRVAPTLFWQPSPILLIPFFIESVKSPDNKITTLVYFVESKLKIVFTIRLDNVYSRH